MARLELTRAELRRLGNDPVARPVRVAAGLHPVTMHELDRLRGSRSRAEVVREAVALWLAREVRRDVRWDRIERARVERERARRAEDRAQRRIQRIMDGL